MTDHLKLPEGVKLYKKLQKGKSFVNGEWVEGFKGDKPVIQDWAVIDCGENMIEIKFKVPVDARTIDPDALLFVIAKAVADFLAQARKTSCQN